MRPPATRQAIAVLPLALAAAVAASLASADVVTTRDGLVFEGRAATAADGTVTVTTDAGDVRLASSRVASVEAGASPRADLRAALAAAPARDADTRYRIALRAEAKGVVDVARQAYESVLAIEPEHAAARRALGWEKVDGTWMTLSQARRRSGLVLYGGTWMLPLEAEAAARSEAEPARGSAPASIASVMRTAAVGEPALAQAAALRLARADVADRLAAAIALLSDRDPAVRRSASGQLASIGDESALRPLVFLAVRDPDPAVRREATLAAASFGNDDAAVPFVRALSSEHPGVVSNAARALATLGDPRAVVQIVKRMSGHGASPRVVVEFLNKVSYIRDYDVEIAQAANIANPVVGTVVDGMVFDVRVIDAGISRTVVETVLLDAFNSLTGAAARDVEGALAWWRENGAKVPSFPEQPRRERRPLPPPAPR